MKSFFREISLIFLFSLAVVELNAQNDWQELASYIETSVKNNNPYFINKAFNYKEFCKEISLDKPSLDSFNLGFTIGIENSLDPGNIIINNFTPNSTYELISNQKTNNGILLIYRLIGPNGVDYHEYTLKPINNEWFITNIYFYFDAISLQTLVKQFYRANSQSYFPEMFSSVNIRNYKAEQKLVSRLAKLHHQGKYGKIINIWEKQPVILQNNEQIMHIALHALSIESPYAVDRYFKNTAIDPRKKNQLAFTVIDGLYRNQEFNLSFKYIDKLDSVVGGDPYLDMFRASTYKAMEDIERSAWCFEELINNFPDDQSGYLSLLELYLENKKFIDATDVLNKITSQFGIYKTDLLSILEEYPGFTNSKEYADWISE